MKKSLFLFSMILAGILTPGLTMAQWSEDPYENLMVRDADRFNIVSHVVVDPAGNSYISWYSATEDLRFDVYMQYMDQQGNMLWPAPGLMLSNHATNTWVSEYGLVIDQEGYAVLINQDLRDGHSNSFAYRVSPEGEMKWGPDGIRITDEEYDNYMPQVIVSPDNDFIFLNNMFPPDTTQLSMLNLKKIGKDGNLLWDKTLSVDMMDLYLGQMLITEDENLMLSYLQKDNNPDTVLGQEHYIHVFLQKFDLDGDSLWPAPVQADTGDVMIYGSLYTIPYLANDGADGAYVVWQSFSDYNPTIRVNHADAGGNLTWTGFGTEVSTHAFNYHVEPCVYYNPDIDDLFVLWLEYAYDGINFTDCFAVAGQKFSPEAERLWSDTAKFLTPFLCAVDSALMEVRLAAGSDNSLFFSYIKDYLMIGGNDTAIVSELYGSLVDADGNYLWPDQIIPVSLAVGTKHHSYTSEFSAGQWILAWEDNRNNIEDPWKTGIYAQNMTIDGNLGPLKTDEPGTMDPRWIKCYPNPCCDLLNLEIDLPQKSEIMITIHDCLGNLLLTKNCGTQDKGNQQYEIFLDTLKPGVYFLQLQAQGEISTLKIFKKE